MRVEGGAAIPIEISTDLPGGGPVLPVYLYTPSTIGNRRIDGGPTIKVYVVSDAQLASGQFKLSGHVAAIPVIVATEINRKDIGEGPMAVYIANNYTPTQPGGGVTNRILLETGDYLLLENGDYMEVE